MGSPVIDERVEECVGCGVVCLGGGTSEAEQRGLHEEEIQIDVAQTLVQQPGSADLRRGRPREHVPRHLHDDAVRQHAGTMDDTSERWQVLAHLRKHPADVRLAADIAPEDVHACS